MNKISVDSKTLMNSHQVLFVSLLSAILMCINPFSQYSAMASKDVSLSILSPSAQGSVNLATSFPLTFQLTGGSAATSSHCNEDTFQDIQFAVAETDGKGTGRLLDWTWDGGSAHIPAFSQLNWTEKILKNGLQCTVVANSQINVARSRFSDEGFIPSYLSDWFGLQVPSAEAITSNSFTPSKLLVSYQIGNSERVSTSYLVSKDSLPTLSITNLERGQTLASYTVINLEAKMSPSFVMEKGYEPELYFGSASDGISSSCASPKIDSAGLIIPQKKGGQNIYEYSCLIQNFDIPQGQSFDISASGKYIGVNDAVANTYSSDSPAFSSQVVPVVAGNPGHLELNDRDSSTISKWPALVGVNSSKPWNLPSVLHVLGYICTSKSDVGSHCSAQPDNQTFDSLKVQNPFSSADVTLCVTRDSFTGPKLDNPKCFTSSTDSGGRFKFSIPQNSSYSAYDLEVTYKGFPLYSSQGQSLSGGEVVSLPQEPRVAAKTNLGSVSINLPQSVKWGSPILIQAAVKGRGTANCLVKFYYPDVYRPGSYAPAGNSSAQRLTVFGGKKTKLKVFLPLNLKVRWYLVMSCSDSTSGAYLKDATGFITNI